VRSWVLYAVAALAITLLISGAAALALDAEAARAVWLSAAVAWVVQSAAFAGLVLVRGRNELFLLGWLVGLALRFLSVLLMALWLSREPVVPIRPALVSLVGFVFLLALLEPLFLRLGLQTK
jgi:hypothetical protein